MPRLTAITDKGTIGKAMRSFKAGITRNTEPRRQNVGWQGGGTDCTIQWDQKREMWSLFEPNRTENRYWNCFGLGEPGNGGSLSIDCEINFPHEGVNRRVAGVFAQDENGTVYATHSGKIGGGRPGIGKEAFSSSYRGREQWCDIVWPATSEVTSAIVIGAVDDPVISNLVAHFVHEVHRFKEVASGRKKRVSNEMAVGFTPEFIGERSEYRFQGSIRSQSRHGIVVQRLYDTVVAACPSYGRWDVGNNRMLDLYLLRNHKLATLFEVKTDMCTSSVYSALGQLMLHGAVEGSPSRIMVLPGRPGRESSFRLKRLGVPVLRYRWVGSDVILENFDELIPNIFHYHGK